MSSDDTSSSSEADANMSVDLSDLSESLKSVDSGEVKVVANTSERAGKVAPSASPLPGFSEDLFQVFRKDDNVDMDNIEVSPPSSSRAALLKDGSNKKGGYDSGAKVARKSMSRARAVNRVPLNPENFPQNLKPEDFESGSESSAEVEEDEGASCIIDLFEEDDLDKNYNDIGTKDMICEVCDKTFTHQKKDTFKKHHRRHVAPDHFQCPTCKRGFVSLTACILHESNTHSKKGKDKDDVIESERYTSSRPGLFYNSATSDDSDVEDEADKKTIQPSTPLLRYKGPKVRNYAESISIEVKYGAKNRDKNSYVAKQIMLASQNQPYAVGNDMFPRRQ